jgi:hypothetical protein
MVRRYFVDLPHIWSLPPDKSTIACQSRPARYAQHFLAFVNHPAISMTASPELFQLAPIS